MSDYIDEGIPVIMPQNIENRTFNLEQIAKISESNYKRLFRYSTQKNDIIYARRGDVEKHAFITNDEKALCGTGCLRVRVFDKDVFPPYLSFYLDRNETRKWIVSHAVGTNMANLNTSILSDVPLKYPSYNEQVKIVAILESLEKKISSNTRINDNLVQQITLLYNYWFTQYDFPNDAGQPYKSSGGPMIYNDVLGRKIPATWNVKKLLDVVTWESNSQPPKSEFIYTPREGYIRFIQNRDYDSGEYKTYIPLSSNLSIATKFDILMDKYGDAGAVRYGIEGAFNVALGKIRVNELKYQEYIRSYLESKWVYSYLHNSCMASTRASLNETNLSMLSVVIPEDKVLLKFQKIAHDIRTSILKTKDENEKLIHLRNWLLPMLMNGQATITD